MKKKISSGVSLQYAINLISDLHEVGSIVEKITQTRKKTFDYISDEGLFKLIFREIRTKRMFDSLPTMVAKIMKEKDRIDPPSYDPPSLIDVTSLRPFPGKPSDVFKKKKKLEKKDKKSIAYHRVKGDRHV